jgi:hypothetical protein
MGVTEERGQAVKRSRLADEYREAWIVRRKCEGPPRRVALAINGSPTWTRTRDLRINSPSLYQLSYRGTEPAIIGDGFAPPQTRGPSRDSST